MTAVYVAARSAILIPITERKYHIKYGDDLAALCGYEPSNGWFIELGREPFELTVCAACRRIIPAARPS